MANDPMAGEQPAAERASEQQGDGDWPKPGEEGFVHPDGTPQAQQQLVENRQAAADRAAAGSIVHGAPVATPGIDPGVAAGIAEQRAEDYSGKTAGEAEADHTAWVEEKRDEVLSAQAEDTATAADTTPTSKRPANTKADAKVDDK